MKAIEQYFHVVLFITFHKTDLTFTFADESLVCDHPNERYPAVLSSGTAYMYFALQGGLQMKS